MKLLLTNTQEDQAYLILRCLRHEASRIVVTQTGASWWQRWSGIAACSRFVNKRYRVPDFYADWRAGIVQAANTPGEERYIRRIEEICAAEAIDTIFPSFDPEVYVFSKNTARFAAQGIVVVAPDFEALTRVLDKSLTLAAARKVKFPTPEGTVVDRPQALTAAIETIPGPWVLKPRCNAHGVNIVMVSEPDALLDAFTRLNNLQPSPLLQTHVPAQTKRNFYLLVNRELELVSLFSPRVLRTRSTGVRSPCAAVESSHAVPFVEEVKALVRETGIWGGMTVQTIVDARDGQPKLMEINPRFGHNLWYRTELGINEPLILARIARGEAPGEIPEFEEGVILLDPLWDLLHLLGQCVDQAGTWLRSRLGGRADDSDPHARDAIPELLRSFRSEYFASRPRRLSPLNRGFLSDPLPPLMRILRVFVEALQRRSA